MRVVYLGGTRFIGKAAVRHLQASGHEVMLIHRGLGGCEAELGVRHLHVDRKEIAQVASDIAAFAPHAVIDGIAYSRADAECALEVWPAAAHLVVLSSADVYRAYEVRDAGRVSEPMPLDEESPLREGRYPYRGKIPGMDDYEKLDVEEVYRAAGATVLRIGFVYGPGDPQRREEFILRRVRANRAEIPVGAGTWLLSRVFVEDAASAIRLAAEAEDIAGEVFNVAESKSPTVRLWAQQILAAARSAARLVRVPDSELPADMGITAAIAQPMLIDNRKLRDTFGWLDTPAEEAVADSVRWHLANLPAGASADFASDDAALANRL